MLALLIPLGTNKLTRSVTDADDGAGTSGAVAAARAAVGCTAEGGLVDTETAGAESVLAGGTLEVLATTGGAGAGVVAGAVGGAGVVLGTTGGEGGGGLTTTGVIGGLAGVFVTG
jgi:hypothetical protein